MICLNALDILRRRAVLPFSWGELVVGHDFGLLSIRDIQAWVRSVPFRGPVSARLAELAGAELLRFEETLWAACAEATGRKAPRPGHERWSLAQDLWRTALLKEALATQPGAEDLAEAVEAVIDHVGSPEDMLGLVKRQPTGTRSADRHAIAAFVDRIEAKLLPPEDRWVALAAS